MIAGTLHVSFNRLMLGHVILLWADLPALRVRVDKVSISVDSNDMLWLDRPPDTIEALYNLLQVHANESSKNISVSRHANESSHRSRHANESSHRISYRLHANGSSENRSAGRFVHNDSIVQRVMPSASRTALVMHAHTQNVDVLLGLVLLVGFGVLPMFWWWICCWHQRKPSGARNRWGARSQLVSRNQSETWDLWVAKKQSDASDQSDAKDPGSVRFSEAVFRVQRCDFSSSSGDGSDESEEEFFKAVPTLPQHNYTWLDPEIAKAQIGSVSDYLVDTLSPTWSNAILADIFTDHGIVASAWSEKQLTRLVSELAEGKSALVRDKDGKLQKRNDIVSVLLVDRSNNTVLQELKHPPYMRDFGELPERLPKSRMRRHETLYDCISRCLQERLNLTDPPIHIDSTRSVIDKAELFPDHLPGLLTITRRYVVLAHVEASTDEDRGALGLDGRRFEYDQYSFKWAPVDECHHLKAHFQPKAGKDTTGVHEFGTPVLPWKPASVEIALAQHSIADPIAAFGKTVDELSAELCIGKLTLAVCRKSSRLLCVNEDVSLMLTSEEEGKVYVSKKPDHLLPSIAKLSNENVHMTAYRLLAALFGSDATLAQVESTAPVVTLQVAPERGHISKMLYMSARCKSQHLFS